MQNKNQINQFEEDYSMHFLMVRSQIDHVQMEIRWTF